MAKNNTCRKSRFYVVFTIFATIIMAFLISIPIAKYVDVDEYEDWKMASVVEEPSVWIAHYYPEKSEYSLGDDVVLHVHLKRRDNKGGEVPVTTTIQLDNTTIERYGSMTSVDDDRFDVVLESAKTGFYQTTITITYMNRTDVKTAPVVIK